MFARLSTFVLFLTAVNVAVAAPAAHPEPEMELIERASLAAVYSKCTTANTVALTFDDGPYIYETQISDILTQNGIKGP